MSFSFVHTADWQIGKPFARFAPDVVAQLMAARLAAIDRVAEAAMAAGARHVLVAGDVFDGERIETGLVQKALSRMATYPAVTWHLLPGNHDPCRAGGIWARIAALGVPDNVHANLVSAPVMLMPGVMLLPAPLAAREMRTDPTAWMDGATSAEGVMRIALAHGSVQGFGSLGEAPVPIDAGRRRTAGLDYMALGDWHGTKEIAAGVWYSGTPEPDSFTDNATGNALVVRIEGHGAPPTIEVVATGAWRWLQRRVVLSRLADIEPVEAEIGRLGPKASRTLLSLGLEGAIAAGDADRLEQRLSTLRARLMHLQTDHRLLRTAMTAEDLASLGRDGLGLGEVAKRLAARTSQPGQASIAETRIGERAMLLLLALAASERAEPAGEEMPSHVGGRS